MVDMSGWNQRKKKDCNYPDIKFARRPIPHCAKVPVSVFTSSSDLTADEMLLEAMDNTDSSDSSISSSCSMATAASSLSAKPKPFSKGQLNDLVHDLGLSKESLQILASRLGEHGILDWETKIIFYRDSDDLLICFSLWKTTLFIATTSKASFQKWVFQVDVKMVNFLLKQQGGGGTPNIFVFYITGSVALLISTE